MHALLHILGTDYGQRYGTWGWYNFWSGFGGDVAIVGSLMGGPVIYWRHHNCHEQRCARLGHLADGAVWCRRHRRTLQKGSDG